MRPVHCPLRGGPAGLQTWLGQQRVVWPQTWFPRPDASPACWRGPGPLPALTQPGPARGSPSEAQRPGRGWGSGCQQGGPRQAAACQHPGRRFWGPWRDPSPRGRFMPRASYAGPWASVHILFIKNVRRTLWGAGRSQMGPHGALSSALCGNRDRADGLPPCARTGSLGPPGNVTLATLCAGHVEASAPGPLPCSRSPHGPVCDHRAFCFCVL